MNKNQFPIYLINLDRAQDRLEFMNAQLDQAGLRYKKISAIDAKNLNENDRKFIYSEYFCTEENITPVIACTISHIKTWKDFLATDQKFALILEDDIHLSGGTEKLINNFYNINLDFDLIKIEAYEYKKIKLGKEKYFISDQYQLRKLDMLHRGTAAYIISRKGAEKLLSYKFSLYGNGIDIVLFGKGHHQIADDLEIYQLLPALAIQDFVLVNGNENASYKSEISDQRGLEKKITKKQRTIAERLTGNIRKRSNQFIKFIDANVINRSRYVKIEFKK